jgi:SAM-dependent methyltransferase
MANQTQEQIHEEVKERYGRIAAESQPELISSCCDGDAAASCCDTVSLYDIDTAWLPGDVTNLSLGCGDPITLAELLPGQIVLDLGSGGGIDCFMAARQVGEAGHVIGIDMTPAMIQKANQNKDKVNLPNVEFRLGQIEDLPVDSSSVDVIISNCVINLSPDKTAVFRETFRVLKPGGRLAVSDMVTLGRFSPQERADMDAWAECITGAEDVSDYVAAIHAAGFIDISVRDKGNPDLELADSLSLAGSAKVFSARVTAVKPHEQ